ncbi:MAG: hypothetical protein HYY55_03200 [Candidatus Niyogibacteria bacterium]|nr:MAG: hypothetical protein HYY55_03200 [Candidatus Niyogibacteria bacterium]
MVKVKKEGSVPLVPLDWKAEVKCKRDDKYDKSEPCGAVLEVTTKDLVLRHYRGAFLTHHYPAVRCSCCGKYNRVAVPDNVWKRINTAKNRKKSSFDGFSDSD